MYYPLFLDIEGRECLVIGGGPVALNKVQQLLACGAQIKVVSPEFTPRFEQLFSENGVEKYKSEIEEYLVENDFENELLVIAATDNQQLNQKIASTARKSGALVNVVDCQQLCDFIVPAVVHRGQLQIAISSGGCSPALAARLRRQLENKLAPEVGRDVELAGQIRQLIKRGIKDPELRREILLKLGALIKTE